MPTEQYLVQLNVEGGRLEQRILKFLTTFQPTIFCTQEMIDGFFQRICSETGMKGEFFPMAYLPNGHAHPRLIPNGSGEIGLAIFTTYPILSTTAHIFSENLTVESVHDTHLHNVGRRGVLHMTVQYGDRAVTIGTTHFMVTHEGQDHPQQIEEYLAFRETLTQNPVDCWTADTNAPQRNTVYRMIHEDFCVGSHGLISTLTKEHRVPALKYLERDVDVIATPKVALAGRNFVSMKLENIQTLSDHVGLIAQMRL